MGDGYCVMGEMAWALGNMCLGMGVGAWIMRHVSCMLGLDNGLDVESLLVHVLDMCDWSCIIGVGSCTMVYVLSMLGIVIKF